jgi:hypothetical protein
MERVRISCGDFTRWVSQEALARHSKLFIDSSLPLREYQVQNPVSSEVLGQFLAWIEHRAEININGANICDFSLLSEEFGTLELTAKCDILSSTMAVSNYNQQMDATSNRIGRLEEIVSLSAAEHI